MKAGLKDDAFKRVNVFYTIGPSIAPGIYTSHKMDFIGINEAPYAGNYSKFSASELAV